jgi:hypothetical protein
VLDLNLIKQDLKMATYIASVQQVESGSVQRLLTALPELIQELEEARSRVAFAAAIVSGDARWENLSTRTWYCDRSGREILEDWRQSPIDGEPQCCPEHNSIECLAFEWDETGPDNG